MVDAPEPTIHDVDALVGAATPHFAYQIRARIRSLLEPLPAEHPVRRYGESRVQMLDRLGPGHVPGCRGADRARVSCRLGHDQEPRARTRLLRRGLLRRALK